MVPPADRTVISAGRFPVSYPQVVTVPAASVCRYARVVVARVWGLVYEYVNALSVLPVLPPHTGGGPHLPGCVLSVRRRNATS